MNVRRVRVGPTASNGTFSAVVRTPGEILGIFLDLGDLSTPDLDVTDTLTAESLLSVDGVASDTVYKPRDLAQTAAGADLAAAAGPPAVDNVYTPFVCYGTLTVAVTGAGANKHGDVYIAFRG
jgi:hypothetical protein